MAGFSATLRPQNLSSCSISCAARACSEDLSLPARAQTWGHIFKFSVICFEIVKVIEGFIKGVNVKHLVKEHGKLLKKKKTTH